MSARNGSFIRENHLDERAYRNWQTVISNDGRTWIQKNLCDLVIRNLNTDYTAIRMIGYLSHYSHLPEEEVVDEMLAILSDRNALVQKKEAEQAQAKINEIYQFGLDIE